MRHTHTALACIALLVPIVACQVEASYPQPMVQAQVDVQTPPPPQVDVQANVDPNAQAQDPNAQPQGDVQDQDPSAISDFRDALAPYGQWMDDPQYGTIWVPNPSVVGGDFTPYQTAGHWVYDNDYTWVSDYDWGWAPFHYGRWTSMGPGRGWGWIPGKEYAGAWVTWRNGDDGYGYAGWAPTPPAYYWRGGAAVVLTTPWYQPPYAYVETANLFAPTIGVRIIRDPVRVREFEGRTRVYGGGGGYVTTGAGVRMHVRGPAPTHFGLQPERLPRPPANNPGLQRAQQFARAPRQNTSMTAGGNNGRTIPPSHPINQQNPNERANTTSMQRPEHPPMQQQQQQQHTMPQEHSQQTPPPNTMTHAPPPQQQMHAAPPPTQTNQPRRPPPPSVTHAHH